MRDLSDIRKIVVKVGSSSLCDEKGQVDREKISHLISQVSQLKEKGYTVVLVSSGAIAAGMGTMQLENKPQTIPEKQALAAIGQAKLMEIYEELFALEHLKCAQVLLNHGDFDDRKRLMNLTNTLRALEQYGVVPIVNENDALAVDEIKVGDNDTLAALLVPVVDAKLLVLVTDIDGLYTKNPHLYKDAKFIDYVEYVDEEVESMASDTQSNIGTGGMSTKLKAARIANAYGCHQVIVNGNHPNYLTDIFKKDIGTWFNGKSGMTLSAKAHWIAYRTLSKGEIIVDEGAKDALELARKSLLPKGVIDVKGEFLSGSIVDIVDVNEKVIGKGITNYSSEEIKRIKGYNTCCIEELIGYKDYDEIIHANNLALLGGQKNGC